MAEHCLNIIAGCKSWLSPSITSAEVFPSEYNVYRHDRNDGYGGVFIACQSSLICEMLNLDTNVEVLACSIRQKMSSKPLIICSLYRPPNNDVSYMTDLCNISTQIVESYPDSPIWIAGDINLSNIDWLTESISNNAYPACLCDPFLNFLHEYGFTQSTFQ